MNRRKWMTTALTGTLCGIYGCSIPIDMDHHLDDQQFDAVLMRLDNWTRAFERALLTITDEMSQWRPTLVKLEKDLKYDALDVMNEARDVLLNDVRTLGQGLAYDFSGAGKDLIDYVEDKLKANLKALRLAVEEAHKEAMDAKAKKDKGGVKRALDKLANIKVYLDPVVTAFVPGHIRIKWGSTRPVLPVSIIEAHGWGFERPHGETLRFRLEIIDDKGNARPCPSQALSATTRRLLQINLATPGIEFNQSDHELVLALGPPAAPLHRVPIEHVLPTVCERCHGTGQITCANCQGKGFVRANGKPSYVVTECDACKAKGKTTCESCAGTGKR
jgi:hypothetical protein